MFYLVSKLIHIYLVISWFAGLFYLPRIYVNLAQLAADSPEYERLVAMSRRLYRFMTPIGIGALIFGIVVGFALSAFTGQAWAHVKILFGALLAVYHLFCRHYLILFERRQNRRSHVFFRYFNEIPVFLLLVSLYLVLFKPF